MAHAGRRPTSSHSNSSPRARRLRRQAPSQIAASRPTHKRLHSSPGPHPSDIEQLRPVLVPLHPNLRRLPSRLLLAQKASEKVSESVMRNSGHVAIQTGSKRKRVMSMNENVISNGRNTRGTERAKRLRSSYEDSDAVSSQDQNEMDVDASNASCSDSDNSGQGDNSDSDVGVSEENSTDEYLISSAEAKQLQRLRKHYLIRLYNLIGLPEDPEILTKSEIIAGIIGARDDDYVSVPPSSPVTRSSDYSSDDGDVAGDEATDAGGYDSLDVRSSNLRRRATMHDLGKTDTSMYKTRSLSMGNIMAHNGTGQIKSKHSVGARVNCNGSVSSKTKVSNRSSPTTSASSGSQLCYRSPPATRLRSRQLSENAGSLQTEHTLDQTTPTLKRVSAIKGKGKGKQVEFNPHVDIRLKTPARREVKGKHTSRDGPSSFGESDLTEIDDLEDSMGVGSSKNASMIQPSPRRLRSKDRQQELSEPATLASSRSMSNRGKGKQKEIPHSLDDKTINRVNGWKKARVMPVRRARVKAEDMVEEVQEQEDEKDELQEDGDIIDDEEELEGEEGEEEVEEGVDVDGEEDIEETDEEDEDEGEEGETSEGVGDEESVEDDILDEDVDEDVEVDELVSSMSPTPPPASRRTPLRKRLRPRQKPGSAGPSDGDDEGDGGREPPKYRKEADSEETGIEDGDGDAEIISDGDETVTIEPRKLRSGKIVGEEDVDMNAEEDVGEEDIDEEDIGEEDIGEEEDEDEETEATEEGGEGEDMDAEGDTDEEAMDEEEVDLAVATAKTLIRLRRDDLIRLCETRNLEPVGTKPQLAQALLQWRDRQTAEYSSPSSTGTIRPPSTSRRTRRQGSHSRHQSSETHTPILSRSQRVHLDEPRTPDPGAEREKDKEGDQELELDLESLGLEDREIPPDKLQKLEKIGSGGFKDVFIGKFKGRKIAIAEFRGQLSAMDIKELKLLGGFDHPNIVRFLGVSIPENTRETPVMIVSELCSNGDLFDYIRNVNAPSLHKVLVMMLDIARGLEYLHLRKPSIIHRDCKSSNILITAKGTAKIADFGLAKVKQSTRSMVRSLVGTVNWQAPELWHAHPKYNYKVDVFSCAMVYWEMLQWHQPKANKKFPWEGMNEHAIYEIVGSKRQRPSVAGLRKQWCPEIVDLIEHMWVHDAQDRPTMTQVVQTLEELVAKC
ncbi:hypothetical protein AMATHDRAFT_44673 [Amanita thiersii Skay4041]|uniref:Protein kinase domain-containing protein n=1 Tax=Amanita thiersii Skay4041 TaxID=703135 RepID=A0A2A9NXB4_9AGAR|nr:hypothetical protein AMATHDRAFT_44673 [Amanita thiersii Skay4041]